MVREDWSGEVGRRLQSSGAFMHRLWPESKYKENVNSGSGKEGILAVGALRSRGKLHDHMYVCSEHTKAEPSEHGEKNRTREQRRRMAENDTTVGVWSRFMCSEEQSKDIFFN